MATDHYPASSIEDLAHASELMVHLNQALTVFRSVIRLTEVEASAFTQMADTFMSIKVKMDASVTVKRLGGTIQPIRVSGKRGPTDGAALTGNAQHPPTEGGDA